MPDWYEDEGFWDGTYPFMFSERMFCSAENEAGSVVDLAGLGKGDILDLACGPGRHATALAKKGFRVTGVDLSSLLLQKAKDLARAEGGNVEWLREDMRRFVRPEAFDLVMSMFTSFGYFDGQERRHHGPAEHPSEPPYRRRTRNGRYEQGVAGSGTHTDHFRGVGRWKTAHTTARDSR